MMAKDPKARYQTPAQLVTELEALVPSDVPLPAEEEMPQLSPAATEGMYPSIEDAPAELTTAHPVPQPELAAARAGTARTGAIAAPAPAGNPFGAPAASPWGAPSAAGGAPRANPGSRLGSAVVPKPASRPPLPAAPAATETAGGQQTPAPRDSNPFLGKNPFGADAPADTGRKGLSTPLLIGVAVAMAAVGVALAKLLN